MSATNGALQEAFDLYLRANALTRSMYPDPMPMIRELVLATLAAHARIADLEKRLAALETDGK